MFKNNEIVTISGEKYRFCNRINDESALLDSFNTLTKKTFGISFDHVGGEYEPHVLVKDGTVCANVSVNQIPFWDKGQRKFYIQLGTVMTQEEERGRGLSRWLMEEILREWQGRCDAIYLFANDSVLDFYPKFGFAAQPETEYTFNEPGNAAFCAKKLSMDRLGDANLVFEKYEEGNAFADFYMMENRAIFEFYGKGVFADNIYYLEDAGVVVFASFHSGAVLCHDLFGKTDHTLKSVMNSLRKSSDDEIILGFTPADQSLFSRRAHEEEDTTLFIHNSGENRFEREAGMFPELSHA